MTLKAETIIFATIKERNKKKLLTTAAQIKKEIKNVSIQYIHRILNLLTFEKKIDFILIQNLAAKKKPTKKYFINPLQKKQDATKCLTKKD